MGHVIFTLDTQVFIKISNVYRNLKDQMKLDYLQLNLYSKFGSEQPSSSIPHFTIYSKILA